VNGNRQVRELVRRASSRTFARSTAPRATIDQDAAAGWAAFTAGATAAGALQSAFGIQNG
jgi:hypothetical protein